MDELTIDLAGRHEIPASSVGLHVVTALRPGVGVVFIDEDAVLLDPATGVSHLLDTTAALVTRLLDGESALDEIAFDIADVLELDRTLVEGDVVDLVRTLGMWGLLEGIARDPYAGRPDPMAVEGVPVDTDLSGWEGWEGMPGADRAVLLVNWGTGCGFCTRIAEELADLTSSLEAVGTALVLLTTSDEKRFRAQVGDLALRAVFVDERPDFLAGLGTPAAYLVSAQRIVLEPLAVGADQVPALARSLV